MEQAPKPKENKEKPKVELVLTRRGNDFHVELKNNRGMWGRGNTAEEALGELVRVWGKEMGLDVKWNKSDPLTKQYLDKLGKEGAVPFN